MRTILFAVILTFVTVIAFLVGNERGAVEPKAKEMEAPQLIKN